MARTLAALAAAVWMIGALSTPVSAQLFGRGNDESQVRLNDMEERLRRLTGQIEQLSYQLRELQDQMRRMQEDNEYRFQQLEGGRPAKRSDVPPASAPATAANGTTSAGAIPPASSGTLGTLPAEGSGDAEWAASGGYRDAPAGAAVEAGPGAGPLDLSALARGQAVVSPPATGTAPPGVSVGDPIGGQIASLDVTGDARTDYDRAYSFALNGDYAQAEQAFRIFIDTYPNDRLVSNAQYWLGESLLAQGEYRAAADAFLKTYTDYPGDQKAPDSLLKLGLSLNGLGQTDAACATYSELLTKFPGAPKAVLDQARAEQQRAGCS
ncbi:Tol-pal system protein YbgF, putative [Polymorphum gilvum SL003B-26A1]|uniref:Cell division coordinator CpoB n=2 Tax=Polymorphum TaxID=991903 RepID=F2IX64_POLGS|nr:Tol-pal system protein YbgF, putative [Polymorphum gilvum SL003B-26A1]